TGETFIKQETIAKQLGLSSNYVWGLIKELVTRGWLIVDRREFDVMPGTGRRGRRGVVNTYQPAIDGARATTTNTRRLGTQRTVRARAQDNAELAPSQNPESPAETGKESDTMDHEQIPLEAALGQPGAAGGTQGPDPLQNHLGRAEARISRRLGD